MITVIVIGIIIVAAIVGFGFYLILGRLKSIEEARNNDRSAQLLNQNIVGMQQRLDATTDAINTRLDGAARVIQGVSRELGTMSQIGTQLAQFQDFLKAPKLRGGLGEQGLKEMLMQALPAELVRYQLRFRSGEAVDAAISLHAGIVPIDAKFPLENFNRYIQSSEEADKVSHANAFRRDFRNRVNEISRKYILPDEGTVEFAIMYVPSESVYYELVTNERFRDLYDYAANEKVIVTSPSTFFYYLRTIMAALEGQRMNQMAHQILRTVRAIQQETHKFGTNVGVLAKHVGNAKNTMDRVEADYLQLEQKVDNVMQLEESEATNELNPSQAEEINL